MKTSSMSGWFAAAAAVWLGAGACARPLSEGEGEAASALRGEAAATREIARIPWGSGPGEAGFRPRGAESAGDQEGAEGRHSSLGAEGPSSVAVRGGSVLVLDRLNERVLRIGFTAPTVAVASVPDDAEHLTSGPDGALAAYSPLRATVWLRAPGGDPAGELSIPRSLREVQGIALDGSGRVRALTSYQESFEVGSPRAPLDLAAVLRTKREGASLLPDGRGVAVHRAGDTVEILVYAPPAESRGRLEIAARHRLEGPLDAARIAGSAGEVVCLRTERITSSPAIEVRREVRCLDIESGASILREPLPPPGPYTPHEELAVGQSPPTLVAMTPEPEGLLIQRWALPARRHEVSR